MPELVRKENVQKSAVNPTQFVMVKNYSGAIAIQIDPYDFATPARRIAFRPDQDRQYLPVKFAIGVFVTDSALRMMEKGYFTFENLETLIKMAEDLGYYVPDSIKESKITLKELKMILIEGDMKKLDNAMLNASRKNLDDLFSVASKLYSTLNMGVIGHIESKYKVSLKPIDLNA